MSYEHRQMRCRSGRSIFYKGRRYRPGELIEGELPMEYADQIEPAPEKPPPTPEPPKLTYANPLKKQRPTEPPISKRIADPFGNLE